MSGFEDPLRLARIQACVDDVADQAGITGQERLNFEDTIEALPSSYRRKLVMILQALKAFNADAGLRRAADAMLTRIAQVWASQRADWDPR
jgi:hypothetical protein